MNSRLALKNNISGSKPASTELGTEGFAVMFRPALIRPTDPGFAAASDAAFETLRRHVERCQHAGWHATADNQILAAAAWALAHGITTLRIQGSLAKHAPDVSLDGVVALVDTLLNDPPQDRSRTTSTHRPGPSTVRSRR